MYTRALKKDSPSQNPATNTSVVSTLEDKKVGDNEDNEVVEKKEIDETMAGKEDSEDDEMKKQLRIAKRHTVDTEVVDGLELSVECASDEDESSSESEDEKDIKPRPRTIIVKAEPNESELDCSSDGEKSDSQRALVDALEMKSEKSKAKKRGSRTSFSKLKVSDSEDSPNSNTDEDYSPRTKKRMKKSSPTTRGSTNGRRSVESKRGGRGGGTRASSRKKNAEYIPDEDEDAYATVAERADKTTKTKNGMEEELSEKERESSSKDESDDNSEREESSVKGRGGRRGNAVSTAVKSYNSVTIACKRVIAVHFFHKMLNFRKKIDTYSR